MKDLEKCRISSLLMIKLFHSNKCSLIILQNLLRLSILLYKNKLYSNFSHSQKEKTFSMMIFNNLLQLVIDLDYRQILAKNKMILCQTKILSKMMIFLSGFNKLKIIIDNKIAEMILMMLLHKNLRIMRMLDLQLLGLQSNKKLKIIKKKKLQTISKIN